MKFLETYILDNSIRSYLIVLGVILFVLILKRYLSRWVGSILFIFIKNNWQTVEKKDFIARILKPLAWFITISIAIFAIDKLNFPGAWKFNIYGHSTQEILDKAGKCLILIYLTWFCTSLIDFIAIILEQRAKNTKDKSDDQLIVFFRDFLKVVVTILGILLIIRAGFNQNIGSLLTGISIVGAAMALAAKESLENLIASFIIFFDKPFYTGDSLKVNNVSGTVEHIGLRSTRIRTAEKTLVTVPNKQMVDSVVDNLSMRTERRAEIKLDFVADSSTESIQSLISAIKSLLGQQQTVKNYTVFFSDFSKNGITITIEIFTAHIRMNDFNELKQSINISLKNLIEFNKLELSQARNEINIFKNGQDDGAVKSQPII